MDDNTKQELALKAIRDRYIEVFGLTNWESLVRQSDYDPEAVKGAIEEFVLDQEDILMEDIAIEIESLKALNEGDEDDSDEDDTEEVFPEEDVIEE